MRTTTSIIILIIMVFASVGLSYGEIVACREYSGYEDICEYAIQRYETDGYWEAMHEFSKALLVDRDNYIADVYLEKMDEKGGIYDTENAPTTEDNANLEAQKKKYRIAKVSQDNAKEELVSRSLYIEKNPELKEKESELGFIPPSVEEAEEKVSDEKPEETEGSSDTSDADSSESQLDVE